MDLFTDLSPKQAMFCQEYFKDFNATKAALRAGYSESTALSGHLMTMPKIIRHLQERGAAAAEEAQVTHKMVLAELKLVAMARVSDFFGSDGKLLPMNEVKEETRAALLNYTLTEDKRGNTTIKIRMNNKLSALDKIAKHLKFYEAEHPAKDTTYWVVTQTGLDADDRYEDDSFEKRETEMDRRIAEAREQAIAETERRMKKDFKAKLKQVKQEAEENLKNTDKYRCGGVEEGARNKDERPAATTLGGGEKQEGVAEGARNKDEGPTAATLGVEEEIIQYRVGDYTEDGHLIMQNASSRDKRSSRYNPNGDFYYIQKIGDVMIQKVYLPVKKAVAGQVKSGLQNNLVSTT